jgi:tetratricopeptide (TPR) repeat protein
LIEGATLATALIFYWKLHGDWLEGRYWLQRAEQLCAEAPRNVDAALIHRISILHAKALYGIGVMAWHQENWDETQQLLEASVALWRATGDQTGLYRAQIYQADLYLNAQNSTVAFALWHECLAYFRQVQDRWNLAHTLFFLAYGERRGGNYAVATCYYEECIALLRTLGEHWLLSLAISHLGLIAYEQGDYATAVTQIEQRLHMGREFGLKHHMYTSLNFLASIAGIQGDIRREAMLLQEALRIESKAGIDPLTRVVDTLGPIALVCAMDGQKERAIRLLAANDVFSSVTMREYWKANDTYQACLATLRTQLGEATFLAAWAAGAALTAEQALEEALMQD